MTEAALKVDTGNPQGALGLYQSVGFKEEHRGIAYRKSLNDVRNHAAEQW